MTGKCEECEAPLGCFSSGSACAKCEKILCGKCAAKYPLIPFDSSKPKDEANDLSKNSTVKTYCKTCFQETSVLDFSKTYDVFEPTTKSKSTTFVMVHGGGASRAMWRPYCTLLAAKGYKCITLDLPGHGTLVDTPLTLDSATNAVKDVLDKEKLDAKSTIYMGGSLGAYTGFYILDKLKDRFCGAIQVDCGQNVGPDCSYKAGVGLWFLKMMTKGMSNKALADAMVNVSKKSPADWKLVESTFGAGQFFDQGVEQVKCLHSVAPKEHIPNLDFPILFMNGGEDYRDSEDKWLSLCKDQQRSSLKVYEGGDHFFTHDSRFYEDVMEQWDKFASSVAK